jgi:uncharacterized protein (TIGR03083 family)
MADVVQVLTEIEAERLDLCDFLEQLGPDEWSTASLCPGWTVHDVLAHVTTTTGGKALAGVRAFIRARGNWERMVADQARAKAAAFPPDVLIEQLRAIAGSPRRAFGSKPLDPLLDVLVHGQDIARPLGRDRPMPVHRTVPALQHAIASPWYGAKKRFRDVRLIATDADWSTGDGSAELRGPAGDLLLVATGRQAGLGSLTGDGMQLVTERLTAKP